MLKSLLTTITSWITKHKRLSVLLGLIIICLLMIAISSLFEPQKPAPLTLNETKKNYQDLQPAISTHQNIIDKLGPPTSTYQQDQYLVYTYPSTTSYYSPDLLYLADDILVLKELFFTPLQHEYALSKLEQQYGQPDSILFAPYNQSGQTTVYVYAAKGMAAHINNQDFVFKIQQFSPISIDTFKASWGKGLLDTQPTPPPNLPASQ